ncbi:MAG TPA: hypothetical protein VHQ04_07150, partial [Puia sp.]|nr:hypothetical protein [Puia sp.]
MKLYLLLFLAISTQLSAQSCFKIRHINIVNVKTGAIEYDQAVLIKGHRIDLIANDEADTRKLSANDIDGTNKYLIPGLWDMHAHDIGGAELTKKFIIPVMLANGVTGLRNMWGSKDAVALRDSISKDLIVAPRMVVGTPLVNGPNPFFQGTVTIKNVSSIQRLVDSLKNMGYDFVKVYSFLRHDLFFSLANYCKEKHIPFEGHVPIGVTAEQASNAGMESIEHLFGIRKSCSTQGLNSTGEWENQMLDTAVSPFEVLV